MFDRPDIRDTDLYLEVEQYFTEWLRPGSGEPHAFADVDVHPDEDLIAATASVLQQLDGSIPTRIGLANSKELSVITSGPNSDRLPRFSPDGETIAFVSDRREEGIFQLYIQHGNGAGEAIAAPEVDGVIEYLTWSPDGGRILLGVAGRGADQAGGQGSGQVGTTPRSDIDHPEWLPSVTGDEPDDTQWRSLWVYDLGSNEVTRLSRPGLNVWEACWAGGSAVAAVCNDHSPSEAAWYEANVRLVDLDGGERIVFTPQDQLGTVVVDPSAQRMAIIEAVCSDRGIVAGELRVVDLDSLAVAHVDSNDVDVTDLQWLDDTRIGYAGLRGFESVYGIFDAVSGKVDERWVTTETSGGRYPEARWRSDDSFAICLHSYSRPPSLAMVRGDEPAVLQMTEANGTDFIRSIAGELEPVTWQAPDELEIQGLLATPPGPGPFPLVMFVHGGPVWAFRNSWTMLYDYTPLLVRAGYAVLHPNPRGSAGRGTSYARLVAGDMGGDDSNDLLAGIDALVERGVIDPARIGVFGGSYGGFMSCWLITRDQRFKAAVPMAPVTNWYSQHHTSNIGFWDAMFLDGSPRAASGLVHQRSPVMHAEYVRTPTLLSAGAQDRCTPPSQALEFHAALTETGTESVCCIYPDEGHGVRKFPARIDLTARVLGWFRTHMPANNPASTAPVEIS